MVYLTLLEPVLKRRLFGHSQLIQSEDEVGVSVFLHLYEYKIEFKLVFLMKKLLHKVDVL